MKVSSEQIENSQVSLSVEMEAGEIDKYMDVAYNHLVGKYRIPGFRRRRGLSLSNILDMMLSCRKHWST
jgi:FKBP-type peptidyl-prolyl cis-trans isomerase (trigger factor)